jgi:hypothetical protein
VVDGQREHGEERPGHAERHRHEVDHEAPEQRVARAHEAQTGDDRPEDRLALAAVVVTAAAAGRTLRSDRQGHCHHRQAADDVDGVGRPDTERRDHQAAEARPDDRRQLDGAEVERQRRAQAVADHAGDHRSLGRQL